MNDLFQRLLAGDVSDLAGLELSGSIPIRQELLNEAIASALRPAAPAATSAAAPTAPADRPKPNVAALLPHVKKAEVSADAGRLTLSFEIRIDPPGS